MHTTEEVFERNPAGVNGNPAFRFHQSIWIKPTGHIVGNPAKIVWRHAAHISITGAGSGKSTTGTSRCGS